MSKISGSALSTDVGGRIYLDNAPEDAAEFPYIVFFIVSGTPDKTFTENFTDILIQFSLFSDSSSVAEIADMYADLKALFDECTLSITGSTLVWMVETNLTTMVEDEIKHWAVDFSIKKSLN
jgi:hypothetical protein